MKRHEAPVTIQTHGAPPRTHSDPNEIPAGDPDWWEIRTVTGDGSKAVKGSPRSRNQCTYLRKKYPKHDFYHVDADNGTDRLVLARWKQK